MPGPHAFDVTARTFQTDVVERSADTPVLLDFHAAWCGPCKTLGPVLEKLADEFGGGFLLGKVDTEAEVELAQAFQVRSIPFLVLLVAGRPVDAMAGALPEAQLRDWLTQHGVEPKSAMPAEDQAEPTPAERLERAVQALRRGDVAASADELDAIPDDEDEAAERDQLRDGLAALGQPVDPSAAVAGPLLEQGIAEFQAGQVGAAMERLIESIEHDKAASGGQARRVLLLCFAVLGSEEDAVIAARRKLATLLY